MKKKLTNKEILNQVSKHLFGLEKGDVVQIDLPTWHQIGTIQDIIITGKNPHPVYAVQYEDRIHGLFLAKNLKLIRRKDDDSKDT